MPKRITAPLDFETAQSLRSGDSVLLSGTIYTARDAAHKRLCELAAENKPMPFPMEGAVIYYAGPPPPPPRPAHRGPRPPPPHPQGPQSPPPAGPSAPPDPPPATAWTPMPPPCSAWVNWA